MKIIYDDSCSFCCMIVKKTSSLINKKHNFYSFKSKKGIYLIKKHKIKFKNSVVCLEDNKASHKGEAVLNIIKNMKKPYSFLYAFRILPNWFINNLYMFVAKNRHLF